MRTRRSLPFMLYPRLLGVSERAWHAAAWERGAADVTSQERELRADWSRFAATLGHKELRRLERQRVRYRLPVPGAM